MQGHAYVCVDLDEHIYLRASAPVKTKYKFRNLAFGSAVYIFLAHTVDGHKCDLFSVVLFLPSKLYMFTQIAYI